MVIKNNKLWVNVMSKEVKTDLLEDSLVIPVLPLRDVVVYPNMVIPLFVGRDTSVAALELARAGNLRKVIDIGNIVMKPSPANSQEDIFAQIEKLASLRDREIISPEEFERKKKELLARL